MIIPASLKVGDTIGFFSPSSPATVFAPERLARSLTLRSKVYLIKWRR
ncbi:hypothetical protein NMR73_001251 [Vibrio navarrensis]|nr:hypothetical protein [Vibrio navarrensis]EJL6566669.1 hypothetical protein [Vibrio navarrensis]